MNSIKLKFKNKPNLSKAIDLPTVKLKSFSDSYACQYQSSLINLAVGNALISICPNHSNN